MTVHESDTMLDTPMGQDDPPETGIEVVNGDGLEPANVIADVPASEDQRWQEILAGFVDDPRGSVQAAIELAEGDVSDFLRMISERKDTMLTTPVGEQDGQTEDMRKTIIAYRAFSRQLAESKPTLS